MRIEKTIKRPDGLRMMIQARIYADPFRQEFSYSTYVQVCEKGKRKFRAPMREQERATKEELHMVTLELWESIKPEVSE